VPFLGGAIGLFVGEAPLSVDDSNTQRYISISVFKYTIYGMLKNEFGK